ncbi:MAG: nucleotidyltransferase domain-containing protein [Saprospiraceae bacterium]|nr:nucleotidyltransferase domain-containing protein [Saprospiraceae bacterium]MCF8248374.1 nucleotidyltransferase domain-containing protein [Saprospiraceae bacterium]MCF8309902.1 nucleotidyltransferase domain-containing protein [Saprospiraceae bacterium]MCF8438767.1 nucleotidyltransferase domain-containing protein [Saprospiraceae bacterium]
MKSLPEITALLKKHLPLLKEKYPIDGLAVFGSYARGEASEDSDLDLMIWYSVPIGFEVFDLSSELETITGLKVDLVSGKWVKPRYWEVIKTDLHYVKTPAKTIAA